MMLHANLRLEGNGAEPIFNCAISVAWGGHDALPGIRLPFEAAQLATKFTRQLVSGEFGFSDIRAIAPVLSSLLRPDPVGAPAGKDDGIELAGEDSPLALTDIPWEAAAWGCSPLPAAEDELFDRLLAAQPICRTIDGPSNAVQIEACRPRLLLCLSNPPGIDGGQVAVGQFRTICTQAIGENPIFHAHEIAPTPSWCSTAARIREFRPNVFIFVGHGSSDPGGGAPTLAFVRDGDLGGVERVPVKQIAEELVRAKSCSQVALIACDTVRTSGYSAAQALIRAGIAEVVAMQGSIEQQCAKGFFAALLYEILSGVGLAKAVSAARRMARKHPHAILPVAFRSEFVNGKGSQLARFKELYERAIAKLTARVDANELTLERAALQREVEVSLDRVGMVAIRGGFGNGASTLLRAALRASLSAPSPRRRPIIYLDAEQRSGEAPLAEWIRQELNSVDESYPVLRPKSCPALTECAPTLAAIGDWAASAEITLVLDNLPPRPTESEIAVVSTLITSYRNTQCRSLLVLGGEEPLLDLANGAFEITIPALSMPETAAYAQAYLPGADVNQLFSRTGGTLLLLDGERRQRRRPLSTVAIAYSLNDTSDRYIEHLGKWLSPNARKAAACLALFPTALQLELVNTFLVADNPGALRELLESGLAQSFDARSQKWIFIPEQKSEALRRQWSEEARTAQQDLTATFVERYRNDPEGTLKMIAPIGGAASYLRTIQPYLELQDSILLPIDAAGKGLSAGVLLDLFRYAIEALVALESESILVRNAGIVLEGVRTALNVGQNDLVEKWLKLLEAPLEAPIEARKLALVAAYLKDKAQVGAWDEISRCYSQAMEIIAHAAPEEQRECEALRSEIVMDSLPTALFLGGESATTAADRLEPLLGSLLPPERALLFATLAEREMKERSANWTKVADWIIDAKSAADAQADARVRTYCAYQYGKYLSRRQPPRFADAWQAYEQSRLAGHEAAEPRREGLALLRLVELERDQPQLRIVPGKWPRDRLTEIDALEPRLGETRDSLGARVYGRLQHLGAQLDSNEADRQRRLMKGTRSFCAPNLRASSDLRNLAKICVFALGRYLHEADDFLWVQRFLGSFRRDIAQRLEIEVDLDKPEACLCAITQWLETENKNSNHGQHT